MMDKSWHYDALGAVLVIEAFWVVWAARMLEGWRYLFSLALWMMFLVIAILAFSHADKLEREQTLRSSA